MVKLILIFGHFFKFLKFLESYPAIIEILGSTLKEFGCPDRNNKGPQLKLEVCAWYWTLNGFALLIWLEMIVFKNWTLPRILNIFLLKKNFFWDNQEPPLLQQPLSQLFVSVGFFYLRFDCVILRKNQ